MRSLVLALLALLGVNGSGFSQTVQLVNASAEPVAAYAGRKLASAHAEAAEIMGTPLGTVKSHVARGKARLLAALGGISDGTPHA